MLTCAALVDNTVCAEKKTCIRLVFLCFCLSLFKLKCNYRHIQQVSNDWNSNMLLWQGQKPNKIEEKQRILLAIKSEPVHILTPCTEFILINWHL